MSNVNDRSSAEYLRGYVELATGDPMGRADTDMRYVLEALSRLGGRQIEMCLPSQARRQPQFDAVIAKLLESQKRDVSGDASVETEDIAFPGPAGDVPVRIYRTAQAPASGPRPLLLYIHGGGWVMGSLESGDGSARAMARKTGAIVISTHYRLAPENRFPAAHDDTYAAWNWMLSHAQDLGGDRRRAAVMGEGSGGNMAANISLRAREEGGPMPLHQVLIHPIAGSDLKRPSYAENMRSRPLNTPIMQWVTRHAFTKRGDASDPRIDLCQRQDLAGLPPTTLLLAEIDPLRSEGEALGKALEEQGVTLDMLIYDGVTHDFFGLGNFVNRAMFAQSRVAANLRAAFRTPAGR